MEEEPLSDSKVTGAELDALLKADATVFVRYGKLTVPTESGKLWPRRSKRMPR
jgi:hypothetical protein